MSQPENPGQGGRRVVITGASRGIGEAIAHELAGRSSWICLVGRDRKALEAVRASLASVTMVDCSVIAGDLLDAGTRDQIVSAASARGGLDLLVNNAGISDFADFSEQDPALLEKLVRVNLVSPMLLSQALLPELSKSPGSLIVNVGSTFAYIGYPGYSVYCASKFGLRGFTEALARELSDSAIGVRLFSPRATATEINTAAVKELNRDLGVREDSPRDVARQFARFLSTTQAEYRVGWPEKLFSRINQLLPSVVGGALKKQLPRIRHAWRANNVMKEKYS